MADMVNWSRIRAFYVHCKQTKRLTQKAICARGGIHSQSLLSRMINNDAYGPTVEVFLRAVRGLDMDILQFFTELEAHERTHAQREEFSDGRPPSPRTARLNDAAIQAAIERVNDDFKQARVNFQQTHTDIQRVQSELAARLADLRRLIVDAQHARGVGPGSAARRHRAPAARPATADSRPAADEETDVARPAVRR